MATTTSSAWQISPSPSKSWREAAALENLHLNNEVPKPTSIPANSALVRIRAAAINARDLMVIAHDPIYPVNTIPELSPCADGAGEIAAVGENSPWKVGDKVLIFCFDAEKFAGEEVPDLIEGEGKGADAVQGTLRQWGIFKDADLIKAPESLNFEETAAIGACGGTAVNALFFGPKPVKKGMTVLTQGTGGVSCFAIQLAAAVGATVIATSSSDEKLKLATAMGATHTINYVTTPAWEKEVLRLTGGKGVDHVVEVGGSSSMEQSLECTKRSGVVSLVGFLTDSKPFDLIPPILFGGKTLRGVFGFTKEHDEVLVKMVQQHDIRPVIGEIFEWLDAVKAFKASMDRSVVGKIVIKV